MRGEERVCLRARRITHGRARTIGRMVGDGEEDREGDRERDGEGDGEGGGEGGLKGRCRRRLSSQGSRLSETGGGASRGRQDPLRHTEPRDDRHPSLVTRAYTHPWHAYNACAYIISQIIPRLPTTSAGGAKRPNGALPLWGCRGLPGGEKELRERRPWERGSGTREEVGHKGQGT